MVLRIDLILKPSSMLALPRIMKHVSRIVIQEGWIKHNYIEVGYGSAHNLQVVTRLTKTLVQKLFNHWHLTSENAERPCQEFNVVMYMIMCQF